MTAPDDDALSPEDAFALVGNEIRAQIIRVLNEERGTAGSPPELSFSELYSRFDDEVGSSQFNYHLQQLLGHFVEATDDGYRIRPEGQVLYRTIRGGTFRRTDSFGPVDVGQDCFCCGASVQATYEDGVFTVQCPDCSHLYLTSTRVPSRAIADEAALLARIDQFDRHKTLAFNRGVCPTCADPLDVAFVPAARVPFPESPGRDLYVHRSCTRCGNIDYVGVGKALLQHPALVAFFHDHDVDLRAVPQWELAFAMTDHCTEIRSRDPWEVALELTRDDETLQLVVDSNLTVVETTRKPARD